MCQYIVTSWQVSGFIFCFCNKAQPSTSLFRQTVTQSSTNWPVSDQLECSTITYNLCWLTSQSRLKKNMEKKEVIWEEYFKVKLQLLWNSNNLGYLGSMWFTIRNNINNRVNYMKVYKNQLLLHSQSESFVGASPAVLGWHSGLTWFIALLHNKTNNL